MLYPRRQNSSCFDEFARSIARLHSCKHTPATQAHATMGAVFSMLSMLGSNRGPVDGLGSDHAGTPTDLRNNSGSVFSVRWVRAKWL
jgi:hypothetical protein